MIKETILMKSRIKELSEQNKDSVDFLLALFKEVTPNWDNVISMNQYPKCSKMLNKELAHICILKDTENENQYMKGGYWLNNGFSSDDRLKDNVILVDTSKIDYKA